MSRLARQTVRFPLLSFERIEIAAKNSAFGRGPQPVCRVIPLDIIVHDLRRTATQMLVQHHGCDCNTLTATAQVESREVRVLNRNADDITHFRQGCAWDLSASQTPKLRAGGAPHGALALTLCLISSWQQGINACSRRTSFNFFSRRKI